MDAHHASLHYPVDGVELGSEMNVAPLPTELNVVPPESEQPVPLSVAPTTDVTGEPQ